MVDSDILSFQASVFANDRDGVLYAIGQLCANAAIINDYLNCRVDWMPCAGLRWSGLGTDGVPYSLHGARSTKTAATPSPNL